jgi:hypothetical protein
MKSENFRLLSDAGKFVPSLRCADITDNQLTRMALLLIVLLFILIVLTMTTEWTKSGIRSSSRSLLTGIHPFLTLDGIPGWNSILTIHEGSLRDRCVPDVGIRRVENNFHHLESISDHIMRSLTPTFTSSVLVHSEKTESDERDRMGHIFHGGACNEGEI